MTRAKKPSGRVCIECEATICFENQSGFCRTCSTRRLSSKPGIIEKRSAAQRATKARPEVKARLSEIYTASRRRVMENPVERERVAKLGRDYGKRNFYQNGDAESQAKVRAAISRGLVAWCPVDRLEENRELRRQGFRLDERKRMILETVPGTDDHARLQASNILIGMRIKQERDRAQAY